MGHVVAARESAEKDLVEAIRAKDSGREAECRQALAGDITALASSVASGAQLLRVWTDEVIKRGRARRWVPENTAWNADAARKLYQTVAEHSLVYWLDGECVPFGGIGSQQVRACRCCGGAGNAELMMAACIIREHTLNMVSEVENIAASHAADPAVKLRPG